MNILKVLGFAGGVVIIILILIICQPWVFLPHKHIEISLPFAPSADEGMGLIPMGEKIEHNESNGNPNGHAGIDFGLGKETAILSVADGWVTSISPNDEYTTNVVVHSGFYKVSYKELNTIDSGIHFLSRVKQGQMLGYSGTERKMMTKEEKEKSGVSGQIHWEFASSSKYYDRLCPLDYFDVESRTRIERIWANRPADDIFKVQYPQICNGYFEGRKD